MTDPYIKWNVRDLLWLALAAVIVAGSAWETWRRTRKAKAQGY